VAIPQRGQSAAERSEQEKVNLHSTERSGAPPLTYGKANEQRSRVAQYDVNLKNRLVLPGASRFISTESLGTFVRRCSNDHVLKSGEE